MADCLKCGQELNVYCDKCIKENQYSEESKEQGRREMFEETHENCKYNLDLRESVITSHTHCDYNGNRLVCCYDKCPINKYKAGKSK